MTTSGAVGRLARSGRGEAGLAETVIFALFFAAAGGVFLVNTTERTAQWDAARNETRDRDLEERVEQMRPQFERWALAALDYEGWTACMNTYPAVVRFQFCGVEPRKPWEIGISVDTGSPEFRTLGLEQDRRKQRLIETFMTWQGMEDRDSVRPADNLVVQHDYQWEQPSAWMMAWAMTGGALTSIPDSASAREIAAASGQTPYTWGEWGRRID